MLRGRVSRHERQVLIDRTREDDADRVRVPRVRRRARVRGAVFGLERSERAERLVVRYGRRREVVDDSRRGSIDDVRGGRGARLGPRADVQIPEEPAGGGGEARRGVAVNHRARRVVEDSSAVQTRAASRAYRGAAASTTEASSVGSTAPIRARACVPVVRVVGGCGGARAGTERRR